jgi:ATP-dependent DNA helicase RecG
MRDQMLNHGLDQPILSTDTGYFQVTFPGPADNLDRIRVPASATGMIVTPAVEAKPNERQKEMVRLLAAGEKLTSRRCEVEFGVTRDTTARDFSLLPANRTGFGRQAGPTPFDQLRLCT